MFVVLGITKGINLINNSNFSLGSNNSKCSCITSNYYGKIETPLLMNITGHSKESTFLTYIGTHQNKDALADLFMQQASVI